jgi:hypothetical protein
MLAGRALLKRMHPFVAGSSDPDATLQSYVGNFTRFLEAASFSHGSQLTVSNIARECGVERKTVEGYLSILEDLLLTFRVPVFTRKAKRATASHPKFYFFDTGLYNALRPKGPLDRPEETGGAKVLTQEPLAVQSEHRGFPFIPRATAILLGRCGSYYLSIFSSSHGVMS